MNQTDSLTALNTKAPSAWLLQRLPVEHRLLKFYEVIKHQKTRRQWTSIARARGHSGFPLGLISDSNFQNGGLNERATVCGIGRLVAAA